MKAEIVTIGDEILIGQIQDTNSSYLAQQLTLVGFEMTRVLSISDNLEAIHKALDECIGRADLVIFTGGLGPTNDDITKKAFADYFESEMRIDLDTLKNIEDFFLSRGLPLTKINKEQASVPDNCEVLHNYNGTAPGMLFRIDDCYVVSFPGVPFEMKPLFENELAPILKEEFDLPQNLYKTFHLAGIPESLMAEKLTDFEDNMPQNARLAYLPSPGILKLRLGVFGNDIAHCSTLQSELEQQLHPLIEPYLFGYNGIKIEEALGKLLNDTQKTVCSAESCTGGTIGKMISSVAGASAYYMGSVIAYSNTIKQEVLGVDKELIAKYGAVSQQVVESMAQNARKVFNADYAIATSGIAGPSGGSIEKPVGTVWIAVASENKVQSHKYLFGNHRGRNIERASVAGIDMLRKAIGNEQFVISNE